MQKFILTLLLCTVPSTLLATDRVPNIIYIMADDLGYGDLSCFGQTKFKTPNIDRLAAEGVTFTDYYAGSTVCAPTRCVLMTGLHTGHAFVRGNREVQPEGQAPMPADIVTLPRRLQDAGYTTGMFGKWGLGAPGSASDPSNHFNEFFGYNCQRQAHTFYPTHLWHNDQKVLLEEGVYSADLINEKLLSFVKNNSDRPFFAYVPFTIPHAAMHVPEDDHAPFRAKWPQFDGKIGKYKGPLVTNPIAAFAGMMTRMDRHVGQLLDLLKELGIDDNTIVSFTSDNGPHMEGGHDPKFFDSNGPLRGHKRDLYEGGIRVPFLARWPGKITPGSVCNIPVAMWDVMPTCMEIAGVEPPKAIDGISYLPALLGNEADQPRHDYLYWAFYERGGKQAVRWGQWKGVRNNVGKNPDSTLELYHLRSDLGEAVNVAAQYPEVVRRIDGYMRDAYTPSELWSFGTPKNKKR